MLVAVLLPLLLAATFISAHDALNQANPAQESARSLYMLTAVFAGLGIAGAFVLSMQRVPWLVALALLGALVFGFLLVGASEDYGQGRCAGIFFANCQNDSDTAGVVWMTALFVILLGLGAGAVVQYAMKQPYGAMAALGVTLLLAGGFLAASLYLIGDLDEQARQAAEANREPATPGFGLVAGVVAAAVVAWRLR